MFYVNDFQTSRNMLFFSNSEPFHNVIPENKKNKKLSPFSLVVAAKPLIYFASLFGSKLVSYEKNYVTSTKFFSKVYALLIIIVHLIGTVVLVRPRSWSDTKSDVPLNVFTKTFGQLSIIEGCHSIVCVAIFNTKYYVQLFIKLNNLDTHFCVTKTVFRRRRLISIVLVVFPIVQIICTFFLRKFHIQNIGAHFNVFLMLLQGSIIYIIVLNIYLRIVMLNTLLMKAVDNTMSKQKKILLQDTICDTVIKVINNYYMLDRRSVVKNQINLASKR